MRNESRAYLVRKYRDVKSIKLKNIQYQNIKIYSVFIYLINFINWSNKQIYF